MKVCAQLINVQVRNTEELTLIGLAFPLSSKKRFPILQKPIAPTHLCIAQMGNGRLNLHGSRVITTVASGVLHYLCGVVDHIRKVVSKTRARKTCPTRQAAPLQRSQPRPCCQRGAGRWRQEETIDVGGYMNYLCMYVCM